MKSIKQILSGILILAFGLLGAYCSWRAIQIHRQLNGQPDIDDSVRDWSTGATACLVACGVIGSLANKRPAVGKGDDAVNQPPIKWWKTPVGMTLLLAVCVVVAIILFMLFDPASPKPALTPVAPPRLPAP
jgi:hypothetical protein